MIKLIERDPKKAKINGVVVNQNVLKTINSKSTFEPPLRLGSCNIVHECHVGAFTYFCSGAIYNTTIGRYCSVARDVNIGQGNHPADTFSSSPIFYQTSFKLGLNEGDDWWECLDSRDFDQEIVSHSRDINKNRTVIGNDVWIGNSVKIMMGVTIGDGAIISAGSVVTKDVQPYSIVGGVPAKLIKFRFSDEIIDSLISLSWWNYTPWDLNGISCRRVEDFIDKLNSNVERLGFFVPERISFS